MEGGKVKKIEEEEEDEPYIGPGGEEEVRKGRKGKEGGGEP